MPWKPEYNHRADLHDPEWNVLGLTVKLQSGDLRCSRCGRMIAAGEMFCIPCFGTEVSRPKVTRARRAKPDDGGLFKDDPGVKV